MTTPLLDDAGIDALREALDGYTVAAVEDLLGPVGAAALAREDLTGVARALRGRDDRPATWVRLFLLGEPVDRTAAARALHPLPLDAAATLVEDTADGVRARIDIRPHARQAGSTASGAADFLVVSDFGSDVRGAPVAADHVLGIGAASLTLARATPRARVDRALDLGTGCGVQALHLSGHAGTVVATDSSARALAMAATTAALSGLAWDLRRGSFLDPVEDERFDLVVANPPFVVSPGAEEHDYRDSGLAGDGVSRMLIERLPGLLAPGGTAQLLANWVVPDDGDWQGRVGSWLAPSGCDAWVWQREIAEPAEYVALWLRDAGHRPGSADWRRRYDAWLDWFAAQRVAGIGMGLVTLWAGGHEQPVIELEDVRQAVEQPIGAEIADWVVRRRRLAATTDADLLRQPLRVARDLVRERRDLLGDAGWGTRHATLRQSHGMRWEVEVDDAVARLVAACAAGARPIDGLDLLAATTGADPDELADAFAPVLRDLVGRGFLLLDAPRDEAAR